MMLPSAVGAAPLWAPTWTSVSTDSPGSAVGGATENRAVVVRVRGTKRKENVLKVKLVVANERVSLRKIRRL